MFELCEVWRTSKNAGAKFLKRIRIYARPDVRFSRAVERLAYAEFWESEYRELDEAIKSKPHLVGQRDFEEYHLIRNFYQQVSDILAEFADIVRPSTLEELKTYGFDGLPPAVPSIPS
jgi:hypothetical protein